MKINLFKDEKGSVLVIVALAMTVIMGFAALAFDLGNAYVEKSKLQNAVDAAALAGAKKLPKENEAIAAAKNFLALNGYNDPKCFKITASNTQDKLLIETKTEDDYGKNDEKHLIQVDFTLAKVIGFDQATLYANSEATMGTKIFEYALFAGDPNGSIDVSFLSTLNVTGDVHSNGNFNSNFISWTYIKGTLEAKKINKDWPSVLEPKKKVEGTSWRFVEMPDFSILISEMAQKAGTIYHGNRIISFLNVTDDKPIYVDGNVYIICDNFTGTGCIMATGDINVWVSNFKPKNTNDSIFLYSKSGNINFALANGESYSSADNVAIQNALLYAPGSKNANGTIKNGKINFGLARLNIKGNVICQSFYAGGSSIKIDSSAQDLNSIPSGIVKLTWPDRDNYS